MAGLVSAEYSLRAFCAAFLGKIADPMTIGNAASAEITLARRLHREATNEHDFRKGSKGWEYSSNLKLLISVVVNGYVPDNASPTFLTDVNPLIDHLLLKWDYKNLRQVFSKISQPEQFSLPDSIDPLVIVVSRDEVESLDLSATLAVLKRLIESPETSKEFVERVDITFHGYDHTRFELFEMPKVRSFVHQLDQQFPFWLYFLSKRSLGLQCLLYCFLPPFLTEEARSRVFPELIDQLLSNRWFPGMNYVCECVGFSDKQIERLTDRAVRYITDGRFSADSEPFA